MWYSESVDDVTTRSNSKNKISISNIHPGMLVNKNNYKKNILHVDVLLRLAQNDTNFPLFPYRLN